MDGALVSSPHLLPSDATLVLMIMIMPIVRVVMTLVIMSVVVMTFVWGCLTLVVFVHHVIHTTSWALAHLFATAAFTVHRANIVGGILLTLLLSSGLCLVSTSGGREAHAGPCYCH